MQGKIFLNTRKGRQSKNGTYPLMCELTGKGIQKLFSLKMKFFIEDWDFDNEEPKKDKTKLLLVRKKKAVLGNLLLKSLDDKTITFEYIKIQLNELSLKNGADYNLKENKGLDFIEFGFQYSNEKRQLVSDKKGKKEGNSRVYDNALNQFAKTVSKIDVLDLDYSILVKFKNDQLQSGNRKTTVHTYLRTLRAVYNEAMRRLRKKVDPHPFEGAFKDVIVKRNRTKKRNISKETIKILESLKGNLAKGQQEAVSLFLLQFYLGGQDLEDIYYLEKRQLSKNDRVYFIRGKLDEGGYEFDVKITDKAKEILKFLDKGKDRFLFPWRKDFTGYTNFRNRVNKNLKKVQLNYNKHIDVLEARTGLKYHRIEVLPLEGYITTKVARHTFATLGSRLYVEPDLLRALMGHERDHVDTIYKDVYPEEERDKHHAEIIDTSEIEIKTKEVYNLEYFNSEYVRSWKYRYFDSIPKQEELLEEITKKKYTKPRFFKRISLIEK